MPPFAGYEDFEACLADQKSKGKSEEAAKKICGRLQADHKKEKSMTDTQEFDYFVKIAHQREEADHTYTYGPVLIPEVVDGQGDVISAEEIEKTAWAFMKGLQVDPENDGATSMDVMHSYDLADDDYAIVECHLTKGRSTLNGKRYPKGTWMIGTQVFNPKLRKLIKTGKLKGFSIEGYGKPTPVEDAAEDAA